MAYAKTLAFLLAICFPLNAGAQELGEWDRYERQDEMTDFMNLVFAVDSENTIPNLFGHDSVHVTLTLVCTRGVTRLVVFWNRATSFGQHQNVHYRIDSQPSVAESWESESAGEVIGLTQGGAIALMRDMRNASRFIIETQVMTGDLVRARFNLAGIDVVAGEVAQRCGWTF